MKIDFNYTINHSREKVFDALKEFEHYNLWWPNKFKVAYINLDGIDQLYLSPIIGVVIVWKLEIQKQELKTTYIKGPVEGFGRWYIDNETANSCVLHYDIEVIPKNLFWKALLIPSLFRRMHVKHMEELFESLNNYLETKKD